MSVAELLHRTASAAWARAELEGPFGPTYSLAHAIHLAATLAANLVPKGADVALTRFEVSPGDTAAALAHAEKLIRSVAIESLPPGSSRLVAMLDDVTRQVHP
ncbi:hypothetical protein N864_11350 [Intrasporangium chromatireducens Q5-1]|uniref:Uncharacterized protein n=1 Tax=Intrasporangium chromatireducens Q5-1 TaxID=584657 RepID=W9GH75_9MICO|nr:hypothetical protein N864_11350 [Intrasporangium chromatireducens Q5-1]